MGCISPIALRLGRAVQFVPCGKCNFCLASKRADWTFRLSQELKVCKSASFLTMTYNDESLPWTDVGPSLCKSDVQKFVKRLRKANDQVIDEYKLDWPVGIRYYTVGEYGSRTFRPHYHSIMFNLTDQVTAMLPALWSVDKKSLGFIDVGTVCEASIHYVTKYVINRVGQWEGRQPPFSLISNRSGALGGSYVENNRKWHKGDVLRNYVIKDGHRMKLPRLFKDKIFSVRERERLGKLIFAELQENEQKELERLAKIHPDPMGYLYDRMVCAYNKVNVEKSLNPNEL